MIDRSAVLQSRGSTVVGNDGQKIGSVEDIYLDRETGEPEWAMVLETEPVTDGNFDKATAGPDISDEEHEVVLHEEEPVVEKRAVPKERVRLSTDAVTEERKVSEEVRKERIEAQGDVKR